jgi:hypothetical protein
MLELLWLAFSSRAVIGAPRMKIDPGAFENIVAISWTREVLSKKAAGASSGHANQQRSPAHGPRTEHQSIGKFSTYANECGGWLLAIGHGFTHCIVV